MRRALILLVFLVVVLVIYFTAVSQPHDTITAKPQQPTVAKLNHMQVTSTAFKNQQAIPSKYTCNGVNVNPPLQISDVPNDAKSLVLIVDDPDAPMGTWTHWVVYNIEPTVTDISENSIPEGGIEATTSFGKPGYGGPCPPSGTHHYHFKLYALNGDITFDGATQVGKKEIEQKMQNMIVGQTELVGLYSKQ